MKLFGSVTKLVQVLFTKNSQDITLRPNQGTTYTAARDIQLPPQDSGAVLVSADSTQTLTNKTISGASNTLSAIPIGSISTVGGDANKVLLRDGSGVPTSALLADVNVSASAAIDASKIANGTVSNTEFQYLDGVTSPIQTQLSAAVAGPASSTDTALVRYNGTTGKLVQDSTVTLSGAGAIAGVNQLDVSNLRLNTNTISATNANGNVQLSPSGTGVVVVNNNLLVNSQLRMNNGSFTANLQASGSQAANYTLTLPVDSGTTSQVLTTSGSGGVLSWTSPLTNPMTTKADLIVGDTGGTAVRLPIGAAGEMLVPNASATYGVNYAAQNKQYKNLIINGNFDFFQRITSTSTLNSYAADRWQIRNVGHAGSQNSDTDVPTFSQSGFSSPFSLNYTNGTGVAQGSGNFLAARYIMEGSDFQEIYGQACRFQFWIKSGVTGTFSVCFAQGGGSRSYVTTFSISSSNTWEQKTIDLVMDTAGGWATNTTGSLNIQIVMSAGTGYQTSTLNSWTSSGAIASNTQTDFGNTSSAVFKIAQVQLVKGDFSKQPGIVIPFDRAGKSIAGERQLVERYFEKSYYVADLPGSATITNSIVWSVVNNVYTLPFRQDKRNIPSITFYSPGSGSAGAARNESVGGDTTATVNRTGTNNTVLVLGGLSVGQQFSVHYTADCDF